MYEPETEVEEVPPTHEYEPVVPVSVPEVEKPAVRQSSRIRTEPVRYGFPPKLLRISAGKIFSSIVTRLTVVL